MRIVILIVIGLFLAGCGGGSSTGSSASTISGVAATGAAVSGTIFLKDSAGHELSMATTNGTFSFNVSALSPPFMLKASWGGTTMYSFSTAAGTANITPLTQMIVAAAANGSNLDAIYAAPSMSTFAAVASNLPASTASLRANLKPLLERYSADMSPITGAFAANGTGMDSLLDHVAVAYNTGTVSVTDKTSGATLFTAPLSPDLNHGVSSMSWTSQQASIARDPDVQVSVAGDGLAVWWQYNSDNSASTIQAQWLSDGSAPVRISTPTGFAYSPHVAFDANGNAIAVWAQTTNQLNNIWINRYVAGSGWGTPVQITNVTSATNVSGEPGIGVDGAGNAIITWNQMNLAIASHFDVFTSRYSVATNTWSAPAMFSNGTNCAYGYKVVVNPSGSAALIWLQFQNSAGTGGNGEANDVWVATGTTTGGWSDSAKLNSSSNLIYGQLTIAIDAAGDIMAAWVQSNNAGLFDIWVNLLTAGGGWEGARTISSGTIGECYGPSIALDGAGNAIAVWEQQSTSANADYIAASRYTAGTGWSAPAQISQLLDSTREQRVAVDAAGNATVVWYQVEQTGVTVRSSRHLTASGWGTPQLIATMDANYDGYTTSPQPRVGVNANGQSFIIWGTESY